MTIRSLFRAVKVENSQPPYDTIHLKVLYPAQSLGDETERNLGIVPADPARSPFPVVIFFGGVNCSGELYQWLAIDFVQRGVVVVTFSWVAQPFPGVVSLTPGVDIAMLAPTAYGTGPTASALATLLQELEQLQTHGILAGMLDLQRVILGGHSAGGRVAIESADRRFFPQIAGAFAYGAHTAIGQKMGLGYENTTILPLPDTLPLLLMGGSCDGVIANSSDRYDTVWETPTTPISRTFQEGLQGGRKDSYLVLLEGANHFSITDPVDSSVGRIFLDFPATQPQEKFRSLIAQTLGLFMETHLFSSPSPPQTLGKFLDATQPLIASWECK